MRRKYLTALIAITFVLAMVGFITIKKTAKTMPNTSKGGFAVVELFTSEGCSSCPAADAAVARIAAKNTANVFILAYHVDYWDRLGWKDPFSNVVYSKRQSEYASVFKLTGIYTPQVIVNGASEFVGSDEEKLSTTIGNDLLKDMPQHISIDTKRVDNTVAVSYEIDGDKTELLNLALVQPEAVTSVKKGENGGRTLHHINIVRLLKTVDAKGKGSVTIEIPGELKDIPLQLFAYTQAKKDFHILGAIQKPL